MKKRFVLGFLAMALIALAACNPAYMPTETPKVLFDKGHELALGERDFEHTRPDLSYTTPDGRGFYGPPGYPFFEGWKLAKDKDGKLIKQGDVVKDIETDITLVAVWGPGYTVKYLPNGGGGRLMGQDYMRKDANGTYVLRFNQYLPPAKPEGRSFIGWNVYKGDEKEPTFMVPGEKIENVNFDIRAEAVWSKIFKLSFRGGDSKNDGSGVKATGEKDPLNFVDGSIFSVPSVRNANAGVDYFTIPEHVFTGWKYSTVVDGKESTPKDVNLADILEITTDVVLTAQWTPGWKINYDKNHPKAIDDTKRMERTDAVLDGASYLLPSNMFGAPPPEGRAFEGWAVTQNGKDFSSSKSLWQAGDELKNVKGDLLVSAVWSKVYQIKFSPGEEKTGIGVEAEGLKGIDPIDVLVGDEVELPNAYLGWKAPSGKAWVGWKLVDSKTKKVINPNFTGKFVPKQDVVAIAIWGDMIKLVYRSGKHEVAKHTFTNPKTGVSRQYLPTGDPYDEMLPEGLEVTLKAPTDAALNFGEPSIPEGTWLKDASGNELSRSFEGWKIGVNIYKPGDKLTIEAEAGTLEAVAQWRTIHTVEFMKTEGKLRADSKFVPKVLVIDGATYELPICEYFSGQNNKEFWYWMVAGKRYSPHADKKPLYATKLLVTRDMWIEAMWRYQYKVTYRYNNRYFDHVENKEILKDANETFGDMTIAGTEPLWGGELIPKPTHNIDAKVAGAYAPTHWGYVFDGWIQLEDVANKAARVYVPGKDVVDSDLNLIARWKRQTPADRAELETVIDEYLSKPEWARYKELNFIELKSVALDDAKGLSHLFDPTDATRTGGDATKIANLEAFDGNIAEWDTSNVKNMDYMFKGAKAFNQPVMSHESEWRNHPGGDLYTAWDVSNVTSMKGMFKDTEHFNQPLMGWNTAKVTDMSEMFQNATAFSQAQLSYLNTSEVTTMAHMFDGATGFVPWTKTFNQPIDLTAAGWTKEYGWDVADWDPKKLVKGWDTSKVTDMSFMFRGSSLYSEWVWLPWDMSNVTTVESMFEGCTSLKEKLDGRQRFGFWYATFKYWSLPKVANFKNMFKGCYMLDYLNTANWEVTVPTNMSGMFEDTLSLVKLPPFTNSTLGQVTDMSRMFKGSGLYKVNNLWGWNTSSVTNMSAMFKDCKGIKELWAGKWNVSAVTNMSEMFMGCEKLTNVDFSESWSPNDASGTPAFKWDVSAVTDFSRMFKGTPALGTPNHKMSIIKNWDLSAVPADKKVDIFADSTYPDTEKPMGL